MLKPLKPKVYFIKDLEQLIRKNRLTLRRWWKKGIFPIPHLINNRLAWNANTIEHWINENVHGIQHEQETN